MLCSLKNIVKVFFKKRCYVSLVTIENNIHTSLKTLLELKSARDKSEFTIYKLAKALSMRHSVLVKLMHEDPSKRVANPRIDTLEKIVKYFREDGFDITLDDIINGLKKTNYINISEQVIAEDVFEKQIFLYSMEDARDKIGSIKIKIEHQSESMMAFITNHDIPPFFKEGSIFIIDKELLPKNENLVALAPDDKKNIEINKYVIKKNKRYLASLDMNKFSEIHSTKPIHILGVVVQIDAKT